MDTTLSQAQDHLKSGAFQQAEHLFNRILDERPEEAEALHGLALVVGQQGDREKACELLSRAIDINPDDAKYHSNYSIFSRLDNKLDEAISASARAIVLAPENPTYWSNRGNVLAQAGRLVDAQSSFEKAVTLKPDYADAHFNLANLLKDTGRLDRAAEAYKTVVALAPEFFLAYTNLGETHFQLAQNDEAIAAFERALDLNKEHVPSYLGLGKSLHRLQKFEEACRVFDQACSQAPQNAIAHLFRGRTLLDLKRFVEAATALRRSVALSPSREGNLQLGIALSHLGQVKDALAALDKALEFDPNLILALFHKTNLLRKAGRLDEALSVVMHALDVRPEQAELWNSLGNIAKTKWHLHSARDAFEKALSLDPNLAPAVNNLGGIYKGLAEFEKARECHDRSVEMAPQNLDFIGNLLFTANYDPNLSEVELANLHFRLAAQLEQGAVPKTNHPNSKEPDRRLKIGLVSGDFGRHPTGYFLEGVLRYADAKAVSYICYSNRLKEDEITARLKGYSNGWRQISGLTTAELCALIEKDEIDVLLDLSGYTAYTRLDAFVHKPAPVQMTWVGSCHTTGLSTMDYILLDPYYIKPEDEYVFSEKIIRLPDIRWIYRLRDHLPDVAMPPSLTNGHITFGSFNNLTKVNDDVIKLWARVLQAVPTAKLMVSWRSLGEERERARIRERFAKSGISPDRLTLTRGNENGRTVFDEYSDIDIALDAFPFSGCITTCEALSMGVPIVTLPGPRPCSRQTLGFLKAIGRDEWVADSDDDYVAIAQRLSGNFDELAAMRIAQREHILASPMCDAPRFAKHFENAFRQGWTEWCTS